MPAQLFSAIIWAPGLTQNGYSWLCRGWAVVLTFLCHDKRHSFVLFSLRFTIFEYHVVQQCNMFLKMKPNQNWDSKPRRCKCGQNWGRLNKIWQTRGSQFMLLHLKKINSCVVICSAAALWIFHQRCSATRLSKARKIHVHLFKNCQASLFK